MIYVFLVFFLNLLLGTKICQHISVSIFLQFDALHLTRNTLLYEKTYQTFGHLLDFKSSITFLPQI